MRLPILEQLPDVVEGASCGMLSARLSSGFQLARVLRLHASGLDIDLGERSREVQVLVRFSVLVMFWPLVCHCVGLLRISFAMDVKERGHL